MSVGLNGRVMAVMLSDNSSNNSREYSKNRDRSSNYEYTTRRSTSGTGRNRNNASLITCSTFSARA